MYADTLLFNQGNSVKPGAGKELVDHTGGEEVDISRGLAIVV
jgi:hypothetical protein